jgi:hypothetical protein
MKSIIVSVVHKFFNFFAADGRADDTPEASCNESEDSIDEKLV